MRTHLDTTPGASRAQKIAGPTAADAHRARNAAFAPGIGIGADESRAPPSAPSRRHDDGSSGEEGVIALIPRSSVYVARFITTTCGVACGVSRDADGGRRTPTPRLRIQRFMPALPALYGRSRSRGEVDEPSLSQAHMLGGAPPADVEPTPSPAVPPPPPPRCRLPAAARRRQLLTRADAAFCSSRRADCLLGSSDFREDLASSLQGGCHQDEGADFIRRSSRWPRRGVRIPSPAGVGGRR